MPYKTLYVITSYYIYPEGKKKFKPIFKNITNYMEMMYQASGIFHANSQKKDAC